MPASDLPFTEFARLQRAFYRYEICRNMWYRPCRLSGYAWDSCSDCNPRTAYEVRVVEIEEVICISQYMLERVENIFDKLGQKFFASIMSPACIRQMGVAALFPTNLQKGDYRSVFDQGVRTSSSPSLARSHQMKRITSLASRTLPFLQTLFDGDTEKQRRLAFSPHHYEEGTFISDI